MSMQTKRHTPQKIAQGFTCLSGLFYLTAVHANASIPRGFSLYASEPVGNGATCHAGAVLDQDGMNQKPFVYVDDPHRKPRWATSIALPNEAYQARITHCTKVGNALYALMQADTQPQQTLSQTLLYAVKLNALTGTVIGSTYIAVPDVNDAYSSWVDKGQENFRATASTLIVLGHYARLAKPDEHTPFELDLALTPIKEATDEP
jgi:hypothetical protein